MIVLGTFGLGLLCAPVTILPSILGIFEIVYGARLLAAVPMRVRPSQAIAILEIRAIVAGNFVSLVVGILALVFCAEASVKDYLSRMNASLMTPSGARLGNREARRCHPDIRGSLQLTNRPLTTDP